MAKKEKKVTKLVEVIQRDTFNEQRPKIQYIVDQVKSDYAKHGCPVELTYYLSEDFSSVCFEGYMATSPNCPKTVGDLPLKEFVDLAPADHERVIKVLTFKFRMEVLR
jgi:hypothetical protein